MQYLKSLMLSRPYFGRIRDESLVLSDTGTTYIDHVEATRGADGSYAMIYLPQNKPVTIDVNKISGAKNYWWYDVRTGKAVSTKPTTVPNIFIPPIGEKDWVLLIDDAGKHYQMP